MPLAVTSNRNNVTIPMEQGLLAQSEPQHAHSCYASKSAGNPHETGFVALLRLKIRGASRWCDPHGARQSDAGAGCALTATNAYKPLKTAIIL